MVRRLNIDGDGQGDLGGHGGENRAVLVYQLDSYRHWADEFGRDDLAPGRFGENLTVDGLPDDEVCIGDRYRIGEAVFEVTQPRVTCYRVGMRIGEPQHGRAAGVSPSARASTSGCITEGEVAAGQEIVKIADGPERGDVAEIDALLYLPGHPHDALERALRIPALSPGWRASLREPARPRRRRGVSQRQHRTDGRGEQSTAGMVGIPAAGRHLDPRRERPCPIAGAGRRRSGATAGLACRPVDHNAVAARVESAAPCSATTRCPITPGSGVYRISVKREPHGRGSGYIHDRVAVGDVLDVAAPRGTFFLAGGDDPVLLLSAGVGITPVLSMLHALAESGSAREVWWMHGARDGAEHPFAAECRDGLRRLPGARPHVFYSRPRVSDRLGSDYTERGRLSVGALATLGPPPDCDAYLCGPADFMATLSAGLVDYGVAAARIHSETFGAAAALTPGIVATSPLAPHVPAGPAGSGPGVGSPGAGSRRRGARGTRACSSSPRHATSPLGGRAERGCATTARRRCCRVRCATTPNRSNHPHRATS